MNYDSDKGTTQLTHIEMLVVADSITFSLLPLHSLSSKVMIPRPAISLTTIVGSGVVIDSVAASVFMGTTGIATML